MSGKTRRLFFALWPSAPMQHELALASRAMIEAIGPSRRVRVESLHLTLAFLGSVPEAALPAVCEGAVDCARSLGRAREPLEVRLDELDWWRRAQIVCAGATRPAIGAAEVADALKRALSLRGFVPDLKSFRAHVTLARHVRHGPRHRTLEPVVWAFEEFALVESRTERSGSLYSVLERWPLYSARGAGNFA